ncbi:hypothetical protein pW2_109 [Bacillus phage pW2]|uniref:Uncharacterized protein n=1 Tax=Bacillus phage pW2 TaxID=2500559 RepID=A0A3Q9R7F5_9CAUD|nr:hypothetical protein PQE69_gp090 [Bacillus phage pW2]AZU98942.1 hypothetical protein pW2_109 [Bacillus phage pW2]
MMKMTQEERREMMSYLDLLTKMDAEGFNCKKEISMALKSLHEGFGFLDKEAELKEERERRFEDIKKKLEIQIGFSGDKKKPMYGKLIRVTEKERALGKTTLLIDASLKYDIPIVVGSKHLVKWTKDEAKKMYGENTEISVLLASDKELAGRKLPNGVLVDCQIALFDYMTVKKWCLIRGGFYHDREFI